MLGSLGGERSNVTKVNNKVYYKVKFGNAKSQVLKIHLSQASTKHNQSSILEHFSRP